MQPKGAFASLHVIRYPSIFNWEHLYAEWRLLVSKTPKLVLIGELFSSDDDNVGMVVGVGVRSSANIAAILSDGLPHPPQQSSCNSRLYPSGKI